MAEIASVVLLTTRTDLDLATLVEEIDDMLNDDSWPEARGEA